MEVIPTRLQGPLLLAPAIHGDERGFFVETYRKSLLADLGAREEMVQDNHSRSRRGVVRGMHFQIGQGAAKLVRCASGEILDVIVDLRRGSPTYAQWEAVTLTEQNMRLLYVPIGFAHGFCVISEQADVIYKQSSYYHPDTERGIKYDDPDINIPWPSELTLIPSQRDLDAPTLRQVADQLPFTYAG
jgi:dTDP-4-dehydrorhamnose 3,5-epimerase